MKTPETIFDELLEAVNDRSKTYIEDLIREIQNEAYNEGVKDAASVIDMYPIKYMVIEEIRAELITLTK